MHGVTAGAPDLHARHDRLIVVHELEDARLRQRHVIIRQIARAIAFVRVRRILPLAAANHVLRAGKPRADAAGRVADREAAGVIEVQMAREHDVDVLGRDARVGERLVQASDAIDTVAVLKRLVLFVAETGVDDHRARAADNQRPHGECDPVALVGRRRLLPQRFRHAPEHRTAVHANEAIAHGNEFEVSECVA